MAPKAPLGTLSCHCATFLWSKQVTWSKVTGQGHVLPQRGRVESMAMNRPGHLWEHKSRASQLMTFFCEGEDNPTLQGREGERPVLGTETSEIVRSCSRSVEREPKERRFALQQLPWQGRLTQHSAPENWLKLGLKCVCASFP